MEYNILGKGNSVPIILKQKYFCFSDLLVMF
jgi:hypothetical protein